MADAGPVSQPDRIAVLDVLRGLALWGVLIGNTVWIYSARWYVPDDTHHALDLPAVWFVELFINGKAMTLLTFMFGLGFALQLVRGEQRGTDVRRPFARRLAVLFLIGWCHVAFIWWGDVTWTYALNGFLLLAFVRLRDRWLLVWAACVIFVPMLVVAIPEIGMWFWTAIPDRAARNTAYVDAIRDGSYVAVIVAHLKQALVHSTPGALTYMPWEIGRFLIGLVAGKRHVFDENGAGHLRVWKGVLGIGLVLACAGVTRTLLAHFVLPGYELTTAGALMFTTVGELGVLGMVAVYIAATVLVFQRARWRRVLLVIAPAGRMPLTTYVMQSVIMTTVFYGRGFGLVGEVSFAGCVGLALVVFPVQIAMANVWLRHYRFGPLEWLWRTLAYGRRQPMRV